VRAADDAELREVRTFCATLAYTGCRISEALALTARPDRPEGWCHLRESKKKRQIGVYRLVPVPPAFLDMLSMVHNIRASQKRRDRGQSVRLWNWSRTKGWYVVGAIMKAAKITGPHATPKGLRHGFRIKARRAAKHGSAAVRACPTVNHLHLRRLYETGKALTRGADVEVNNRLC
jgi:integrase/recombinase XerD